MAVDFTTAVSATIPNPSVTSPYATTDPEIIRKTYDVQMARKAETRRLEEIQCDQIRAETTREDRARREQITRNASGEVIGTTFNAIG